MRLSELERQAFAAAVEEVAPSVVTIETIGGLERVGGVLIGTGPTTGLVVSRDGYIVSSAFNFAQKPTSILVGLSDGTRTPAKLVATDFNRMLVLLKVDVDESLLTVPKPAPVDDLRVGQWSIAVGRTFAAGEPNISIGILSALKRIWTKAVQTDAKISPANYGGPLIDVQGRVIGVLVPLSPQASGETSGVEWYDSGIGFAVPLEEILALLPRLEQGKDLRPGVMGISLKGEQYGEVPEITASRPNSPAAKAGLKAGDKIVEIEGTPITQRHDLQREIQRRYAGDTLRVVAMRDKERLDFDVQLVDKLEPYRRPFLGLLPMRDAGEPVVVRYVYPDSPAAKAGVEAGDTITSLADQKVEKRADFALRVASLEIDKETPLEVKRGKRTVKLKIKPTTLSDELPKDLPTAFSKLEASEDKPPEVGIVELTVPQFENDCLAYVPEDYDARRSYGLLVWLHGPDGYEDAALVKRWKELCERDDFILLAPKSAEKSHWDAKEAEYVAKLIEQVKQDYHIDPLRVVAYGFESGGTLAHVLARKERDQIRGVVAVNAPISVRPPDNDPEFRLDYFIVTSDELELAKPLEAMREMQLPIHEEKQGKQARHLDDAELEAMLRWFDTLDKL